jgi:cell division septation protein DedD
VTAALLPRVDSIVWRSGEAAPALARVLAFDVESGMLAAVDTAGRPTRIDLRLGTVRTASRTPLTALAAAEGGTFFGLAEDGSVTRLTPSGDAWKLPLRVPAQELFPQRDGSVLAAGVRGGTGYVWRLRPPTTRIADSATVAGGGRAVRTGSTDRVYFATGTELHGVRSRDLEAVPTVTLPGAARAIVATPSGDRLYVALQGSADVAVVDRFRDAVARTITLPGEVRDLRVDPLGRYLLARPARGDSAWVVAVGDDRVLGRVAGAWRDDLPLVTPDGRIAAATGADVTLLDGATLQPRDTVAGGAADFWHVVQWNGFRPRAAELDRPVTFGGGGGGGGTDSTATDSGAPLPDSAAPLPDSTQPPAPLPPDTAPRPVRPTVPSPGEVALPPGEGYTVQFAAAESEREARAVVRRVSRRGRPLRVVPATRDGRTFYRVVSGPFPSRAEAERAARTTGLPQYWVYEGVP